MSRKVLAPVGWGVVGFAVALILAIGSFALAGRDIAEPATPSAFLPSSERTEPAEQESRSPVLDRSDDPSPSGDDQGGNSGPGGEDGGSDDNSGPGSNDDNSGPGSSSAGSDDNSGSGSDHDNSGSGSEDHGSGDHDDD